MNKELKYFVKPFGFASHKDAKRKFVTYCKITSGKFSASYKSYTYLNDNKTSVDSFLMTDEFAMAFAVFCDPETGLEFISKLANKDKLLLANKEQELLQLTTDLADAKAKVPLLGQTIRRKSSYLQLLVDQGVCDKVPNTVTIYSYPVTLYGQSLGYYNNDNGTLIEP